MVFGATGYGLYAAALLAHKHHQATPFNIFAGCYLGVCAGLLWTAQGTIMLSYPREQHKGKYFALFWGVFNSGGVVGSMVSFTMRFVELQLRNADSAHTKHEDGHQ